MGTDVFRLTSPQFFLKVWYGARKVLGVTKTEIELKQNKQTKETMKRSLLVALLAPVLLAGSANAAVDMFLEIDGVKGESKDEKHKDEIDIESFSWKFQNETSTLPTSGTGGTGGGAGKVSMQDFHFVAKMSMATPQIMTACASGKHIPKATLTCRKAGSDREYYILTLQNVLVRSQQNSGRTGSATTADDMPTEEVAFYFESLTLRYVAEDGTITEGGTASPNPQ